ncbi:DNA helicase HerA-like ATPase [Bradyrhizobium sp. USDA 3686]|uniref:ATP-binding protein n=1 Tax=Bradyrhizobium TaxID=374 RepID=UPI00195EA0FA|nr:MULTISPECIES: ATP-binding protein [Bradyrhizobium]MCK1311081.1 ATP-binding protein [Bradyrhizobium sp. 45]MCK1436319.1 ATP-binding protein [Bradyrhizobium sp. 15]MCK1450933.1 ATP-binding protein [Bradyrhizobium sp. 35]MCK1537739.1 ATP-binding protein [Bradyrhizobium sp. 176]MCK1560886.1 ATP-binding protein [Bradyrhizobium sp. 171]MCK1601453.1 ATP-binding protein [Bradyrhizobium sp. 166]MCK1614803.1 ATP-binding protein [Bradyrhizobium sp. 163]MCK1695761.1 ATP-binding protein [Bradyrhizobi
MTSFGRVISVRGSLARVGLLAESRMPVSEVRATVGRFVSIRCASSVIVAMITEVSCENLSSNDNLIAIASVDLLGEILNATGKAKFQRGVTNYPTIGDSVDLITSQELRTIYAPTGSDQINVGFLQQDSSVVAYVDIEEMLSKHFAVLGSTGVGKSTGVSLLLNEILKARPNLRIFLLDVHNEYGRCFGDRALVLNPRNLKLPFWLFNFEEIVDVLFGGRAGVPEELDVLAEVIPLAKGVYTQYQNADRIGLKRIDPKQIGYTVDTPVPYRLVDLMSLIDERMGKLENRSSRIIYHKLISRIEAVRNDPRYAFMFDNANVGGDTMAEVISHLFRLPANGKPMTVMQLAGFPAEVIDSVVSVLCRMAFDFGLWSDGVSPMLFVCEEAHRYASADRNVGFGPTRKAVSRIAKEGRKYGVYLGLITQRPAELDATIISQCNTLFTMRLANERDQALLRAAVSDAAANLLSFVPSLGTREVLAFGEGVALPTRLRFKEVPPHQLPRGEATISSVPSVTSGHDMHFVGAVLERWRGATSQRDVPNDPVFSAPPAKTLSSIEAPMLQPSMGLDPDRFSLLKKPLR